MKSNLEQILNLNCPLAEHLLTAFIQDEVWKVGYKKVVLGLSGGIDSAVVAALASRALGSENVYAIMMPYATSNPDSLADATQVAEHLDIKHSVIEITTMIDSYFTTIAEPNAEILRRGNKMARERMSVLYDQSSKLNALVIGTSNKTELLLGYGTIYGDMASALNPIGDLYKHQIYQLAKHLNLPKVVIEKAPSADLWEGQTDEQELGYTYDELDCFLYYKYDCRYSEQELAEMFAEEFINAVTRKVRVNHYKRKPPVIAKVSNRSVGHDFLYPRDWMV